MAVLPFPYSASPTSSLPLSQQKRHKTKPNSKRSAFSPIQCCHSQTEPFQLNGLARVSEKILLSNPPVAASGVAVPPRPRRIILVRHGESEGNVDESVYTRIPDPKISLTEKGRAQAEACGNRIKQMIEKEHGQHWQVYFYVSPYRRTLQTLQHLARPFDRSRIAGFREEPRIREQDFGSHRRSEFFFFFFFLHFSSLIVCVISKGNFQNRETMRLEKALRQLYGRFFYRFPNGESAADVYDRITGNIDTHVFFRNQSFE